MTFGLIELMVKKKRPREHIIADLSVNYVKRWVFLCGYSVERIEHDYGFDFSNIGESVTVHLPKTNILNQEAVKKFAEYRNNILKQLKGVIRHHG